MWPRKKRVETQKCDVVQETQYGFADFQSTPAQIKLKNDYGYALSQIHL